MSVYIYVFTPCYYTWDKSCVTVENEKKRKLITLDIKLEVIKRFECGEGKLRLETKDHDEEENVSKEMTSKEPDSFFNSS